MSYFFPNVRYLSKPTPAPPPVGTKRWFANTISRQLDAGEIEQSKKYVEEESYDAVRKAAEYIIGEMEDEIIKQGKAGFVRGLVVSMVVALTFLMMVLVHGCSSARTPVDRVGLNEAYASKRALRPSPGLGVPSVVPAPIVMPLPLTTTPQASI